MAFKTEVIGLDRLRAKGRSLESDVHGEVVKEIRKEVTGFEAEMHVRAAAFGRIGRRAARTLGVVLGCGVRRSETAEDLPRNQQAR
jgi:hypothetical protein